MRRSAHLVAIACVLACDGDGCHGGPDGPATNWCQEQLARTGDAGNLGLNCEQCCTQEVKYKGVVENGLCVCR